MKIDQDKMPASLNEAIDILMAGLDDKDRAEIDEMLKTDSKMRSTHFGFGMYLRNNWSLWEDNIFTRWFIDNLKICHADDISAIIMEAFSHRYRGLEYDPQKTVAKFHKHWVQYYGENAADKMIEEFDNRR